MRAVIPAAGMASRLRPLTDHTPKCLLPIGGKSLLQRAMDGLIQEGIEHFTIVTGYLGKLIQDFVSANYPSLDVHFLQNPDYETTNNIYSLYLAREDAEGKDILLLDSDIVFDPQIVARLLQSPQPDTLALSRHPLGEEEIKVITDSQGMVTQINKVCSISDAIGESIGIEKMSAAYTSQLFPLLEQMIEREGLKNVFYEKAFERLIQQGLKFGVTDVTDLFCAELDTPEDFMQAKQEMEN